ncbi:TIM21-domain-containing protein [Vararia minispora EC-137]|uniref:TIM21-domain-containing protein n=1 Tax=Vararia minispora EC-137 TaxID=1314806 RepID=A0ACB8QC01_9AGAM|nr:TIM21-domain-containing protein [Vararia minispora EC-137]
MRLPLCRLVPRPPSRVYKTPSRLCRAYATHTRHPTASSLLSETLDHRQRSSQRVDNVGPFQLGLNSQSFAGQGRPKPWSELSAGGKAARATARTTNLVVILFGAGLTAVLVYALTSELFSSNSPTVLYNDACERIRTSPRVARQLPGNLVFHTSPPSALRPRHRNRTVTSQLVRDSSGHEHLLLSFYVQAAPPSASAASYLESFQSWLSSLPTLSSDDLASVASSITDRAKSLFRYLTGDAVPVRPPMSVPPAALPEQKREDPQGVWGSIAGVFGSLRGTGKGIGTEAGADTMAGRWQEGEVHVDFEKDASGNFVYRYLLIDIPNSRIRNPVRIFVERANGVRENEPVIRWDVS